MKIKKHLQIDAITNSTGRLPSDMENITQEYYSESQDELINIGEMDLVYLIRAFNKQARKLSDEYDVGLEASVSQTNQIMKLEKEVSHLRERLVALHKRLEEKSYKEVTAPRYVFSEIPNDCDGQRFVDDARKYFNRSRYNMRVRGQHVKEEYKGTGATSYGQNIDQSTHLRVYIEEK